MDAEQHFATLAAVWDEQADAMDTSMGEHAWAAGRPGAGFVDIDIRAVEAPFVSESEGKRREVVDGVTAAFDNYRGAGGFPVPAASWCITARRP
ncbi:hypothetical protein [Mycolicibacterium sphagni]|uniref:Uncharacterized protein n=1 Tax=Mycolicibacterium sphagni TaxID=1786 RepID=A0ABX2JQ21_9MYCO|nr:hypothetical protein [Mycolicibacterium sphagni]NTY58894.1 hypothetical protein [Mycolicibacterium sphagni]